VDADGHWLSLVSTGSPDSRRRGQVRVTLSHLPHGAYEPAKGTRLTMLPWFYSLQSDLETLKVIKGGT